MLKFTEKKLGEVVAFLRLGTEVSERGGAAFVTAFGTENASQFKEDMRRLEVGIVESYMSDAVHTKAELTVQKLRTMMEQYVGDAWKNPVELLEWLSFYGGAAVAHTALVVSVLDEVEVSGPLRDQLAEARQAFAQYYEHTVAALEAYGRTRALG